MPVAPAAQTALARAWLFEALGAGGAARVTPRPAGRSAMGSERGSALAQLARPHGDSRRALSGADRLANGNASLAVSRLGLIVAGCLFGGPAATLPLVLGPLAAAREHVIVATILLGAATGWALLASLSAAWTQRSQRWAAAPAAFMGTLGVGLLVFAPQHATLDAAGLVWPPLFIVLLARTVAGVQRDLHSRSRAWVVYPVLVAYALGAAGASYQAVCESRARQVSVPLRHLVDVGGHRLYLHCVGFGLPTVVLEAGLGETAQSWAWIAPAVAREARVCVYDRAGRGWSEPAPAAQDGEAVAADLHALLDSARVPGPYVIVGHSSGAAYARIFADRHAGSVAGMVLLDGQPSEAFESLPGYAAFHDRLRRVSTLLPVLAHLGLGHLLPVSAGLPDSARGLQRSHQASARFYRSLRDEVAMLPATLAQAREASGLADRPLVVVTAGREALDGWLPMQARMAALSANSSHRIVPYTHEALLSDRSASQASIQAICDVVRAVRSAVPLSALY